MDRPRRNCSDRSKAASVGGLFHVSDAAAGQGGRRAHALFTREAALSLFRSRLVSLTCSGDIHYILAARQEINGSLTSEG